MTTLPARGRPEFDETQLSDWLDARAHTRGFLLAGALFITAMGAVAGAGAGLWACAGIVLAGLLVLAWLYPQWMGLALVAGIVVGGRAFTRIALGPGLYIVEGSALALLPLLLLRKPGVWRATMPVPLLGLCALGAAIPAAALGWPDAPAQHSIQRMAILFYPAFVLFGAAASATPAGRKWTLVVLGTALPVGLLYASLTSQSMSTTTGAIRYIAGPYAGVAAMTLPIVLTSAAARGRLWLHGGLFVTCLAGLALASHRSAWIAATVGVMVVCAIAGRGRSRFVVLTTSLTLVVVAAGMVFTLATDRANVAGDQLSRIESLRDPAGDANGRDRLERWGVALRASSKHLFLGEGFGVLFTSPVSEIESEPHNFVVTMLARAGLISTLFFLWMMATSVLRTARTAEGASGDAPLAGGLGGALAAGIVFGMFNVVIESPYFAPVFWFAAGAALQLAFTARLNGDTQDTGPDQLAAVNPGPSA